MCECMCVIVCDWERCVQKQVKCFQRNTSAVTWNTRKQSIVLILEKHLIRLLVSFSPVLVHILLLSACVRCSLVENKSNAGLPYLKSFKQFFSGFFFFSYFMDILCNSVKAAVIIINFVFPLFFSSKWTVASHVFSPQSKTFSFDCFMISNWTYCMNVRVGSWVSLCLSSGLAWIVFIHTSYGMILHSWFKCDLTVSKITRRY